MSQIWAASLPLHFKNMSRGCSLRPFLGLAHSTKLADCLVLACSLLAPLTNMLQSFLSQHRKTSCKGQTANQPCICLNMALHTQHDSISSQHHILNTCLSKARQDGGTPRPSKNGLTSAASPSRPPAVMSPELLESTEAKLQVQLR